MKIGIYTIAKNEFNHIERWTQSLRDADHVTFCDTGSTDNTILAAEKFLGPRIVSNKPGPEYHIHELSIDPWRFDDAHNAALALVPSDVDVCIPLHLDEVLMPGWREALEREWKVDTTKCFYTYVFSHHPDGTPELQFLQNRIHARRGYRWKYPDHEGVYPYNTVEKAVTISDLRIEQWADRTKDRSGSLMRLAMGVAEYPNDSRMAFYFGRELMYYGKWQAAISQLERYLALPGIPFAVERAQAADCLAHCYRQLG